MSMQFPCVPSCDLIRMLETVFDLVGEADLMHIYGA